jgi:SSS family solute:Na+ symporter
MLVLAASMSTLSSLVLTSASTLTLDVIVPLVKKEKITEKKSLFVMRLFIVFFIAVSAAIAIIKDAFPGFTFIAQMMGVSWGALAGAFLAPFLYGLYSKKITRAAVAVSFVYGVGLELVQLFIMLGVLPMPSGFLGFIFTNSLYSGVFAMVGGLILVPVVSLFTKKQEAAEVDGIFSCYDRKVLVNATDALHHAEEIE